MRSPDCQTQLNSKSINNALFFYLTKTCKNTNKQKTMKIDRQTNFKDAKWKKRKNGWGYTAAKLRSIGHFRVAVNLVMKARLSAKLFI